ncbi:hypothetical protein GQ53DRAFT_615387, partial [Thozetella sp. PMI_491]
CPHGYCPGCLRNQVRVACAQAKTFPPQCCGRRIVFPTEDLETLLGEQVCRLYRMKLAEHRASVKVYCRVPTCSALIVAVNIQKHQATCQDCGVVTCRRCLGPAHSWIERLLTFRCRPSSVTVAVRKLATRNRWRRCSCGHWVEKSSGCLHMTCLCGAEWCYRCGARWPTCNC